MAPKSKPRSLRRGNSRGLAEAPIEQGSLDDENPAPAEAPAERDVEAETAEAPDTDADVETIHDEDTSTGRHVDSIEKI